MITTCFEILEVETLEESYWLEPKHFHEVLMSRNNSFPLVFYFWKRLKYVSLPIHI